jgi:hypothetical protein
MCLSSAPLSDQQHVAAFKRGGRGRLQGLFDGSVCGPRFAQNRRIAFGTGTFSFRCITRNVMTLGIRLIETLEHVMHGGDAAS